MKSIVVICSMLGLAVLPACSGKSEETGGEAGTTSGGASGSSGSGGTAGTNAGGSGGAAGTSSGGSAGTAGTSSGGSAGTAGTSGTGGSGGVAGSGSGGSAGGGGSSGGSSCGCVEEELSWNRDGGFVAYREASTLAPCHTFTLVREPVRTDPVTQMCTDSMESCEGIVNPAAIQAALEHPDVVRAFADSPVLFGRDIRAVDGQVLQIHLGSALIEIGRECMGSTDCTDEPPGVAMLRMLLESLTEELSAREPCSDLF